ncbi:MAG TPA: DUF4402 domain-containing protein [Balneolales bacterium]|nr:DUF4402 domain-containing protein [Balneolales bacterium]
MKKVNIVIIATVLIVSGFTYSVKAQASVGVSANVLSQISLSKTDVNFGTVQQGSSPVINPDPGAGTKFTDIDAGGQVGEVIVSGSSETSVAISFDHSSAFNLTNGSNTLSYTPTIFADTSSTGGSTISSSLSGFSHVTNTNGNFYVWIGGSLGSGTPAIPTSQATGSYTGTLTVTVSYN